MTDQSPSEDEILAGLDFEPETLEDSEPDSETETTVDVTGLSDLELVNLLDDTRIKLREMGEMYSDLQNTFSTPAASPEARVLHNLRAACLVEQSKRGLR